MAAVTTTSHLVHVDPVAPVGHDFMKPLRPRLLLLLLAHGGVVMAG